MQLGFHYTTTTKILGQIRYQSPILKRKELSRGYMLSWHKYNKSNTKQKEAKSANSLLTPSSPSLVFHSSSISLSILLPKKLISHFFLSFSSRCGGGGEGGEPNWEVRERRTQQWKLQQDFKKAKTHLQ